MEIGTARSQPGQITYGEIEGVELPTGGVDTFPVIIAQGKQPGPILWITASIHGDEYTGILAIHQLLNADLVNQMQGTIVALPTLNPSGLRVGDRRAYFMRFQDPNRLFPVSKKNHLANDPLPPLELAYRRLFELIVQSADYLIDLHNYSIGAFPFSFRDPVGYKNEAERIEALKLQSTMNEMMTAFGHTVINEYASADYLRRNLHRSVSGAVLNAGRIPAFTVELGGYLTVDPVIVAAAVSGLRNVMRWAGMLDGGAEPIKGITVLSPGYPIRRIQHPVAPNAGIVRFFVKSGDRVRKGDTVAQITDIYGRPIGDNGGNISTDFDGFILGITQGAAFYKNDVLLTMAIKDDSDLIVPFPS